MLVLSRKKDEEIVIGTGDQEVVVRIIDVRGDKVRLGVIADKGIPVHRREVWNQLHSDAETELIPAKQNADS